jgi:hypothetical protein
MRGDKSFAYDLLVRPGRVSGRVALLLRSAERKPVAGKICGESLSSHQWAHHDVRHWRGETAGWGWSWLCELYEGLMPEVIGLEGVQ